MFHGWQMYLPWGRSFPHIGHNTTWRTRAAEGSHSLVGFVVFLVAMAETRLGSQVVIWRSTINYLMQKIFYNYPVMLPNCAWRRCTNLQALQAIALSTWFPFLACLSSDNTSPSA